MAERVAARRRIIRFGADGRRATVDTLAGEEPMEVRVDGTAVSVTMRTPGNDFELALGFCLTEGIVDRPDDVAAIRYCGDDRPAGTYNIVDVRRRVPSPPDERLRRNVYTTSSCGVCGTTSIDAVRTHVADVGDDQLRVAVDVLATLPDRLRHRQRLFDRTGGLHAAALALPDGELRCVREDVGRHNAVDKVVGRLLLDARLPADGLGLYVSGRASFEIVQKAWAAGFAALVAVSAPTSLAVETARAAGMTLAGFVRGNRMTVYAPG
ncbi:MAG: formate dehydrogenase accessory sulfurtransferase FdhD [Actinobacteria bacterium]|nr:formate dehydrogenase accessory sulfurtransferase FdhD [Actinomycetota bacterium]